MQKKLGFTLIELLIVMTIAGILAGVSISGYMGNLRTERRQDAALSMQKAYLIINSTPSGQPLTCPTNSTVQYSTTSDCPSDNRLYNITYNATATGFPIPTTPAGIENSMMKDELLILKAIAISGKGQDKDIGPPEDCRTMFLSTQNKIYPISCSNQ